MTLFRNLRLRLTASGASSPTGGYEIYHINWMGFRVPVHYAAWGTL